MPRPEPRRRRRTARETFATLLKSHVARVISALVVLATIVSGVIAVMQYHDQRTQLRARVVPDLPRDAQWYVVRLRASLADLINSISSTRAGIAELRDAVGRRSNPDIARTARELSRRLADHDRAMEAFTAAWIESEKAEPAVDLAKLRACEPDVNRVMKVYALELLQAAQADYGGDVMAKLEAIDPLLAKQHTFIITMDRCYAFASRPDAETRSR